MITITVDLTDATPAEAESYMNSRTRQCLLYEAADDLEGCKVTIASRSESHFVQPVGTDADRSPSPS